MTTAKDVGSIILLVLLSPLALIALLLGALFAIPVYIIGVIVAFARHDELSGWKTRIKVALRWPLEAWLKLKTIMRPGKLDLLTKEIIALAVSITNSCVY